MGNRSYLYDKEGHVLFEVNNSLPLFWLGLLNTKILDRYRAVWQEYEQALKTLNEAEGMTEEDIYQFWYQWTGRLDFIVTQKEFLGNSQALLRFSQRNLGDLHELTRDFVNFLRQQLPETTDYLRLSVLEFSDFYEAPTAFLAFLEAQVRLISANQETATISRVLENPLGEGTGYGTYAEGPAFGDFSQKYQSYETPVPLSPPLEQVKKKKSFFGIILVILLALICLTLLLMFKRSQLNYVNLEGYDQASSLDEKSLTQEKNTQIEVDKERVEFDLPVVFNILSEGDISDKNGNSWLVMESEEYPDLLLQVGIKNKRSSLSPQTYSLNGLGLTVIDKTFVDYHGFFKEMLWTLGQEKGLVYQFETEETQGELSFISEGKITDEEGLLFEQLIDSLAVTEVIPN